MVEYNFIEHLFMANLPNRKISKVMKKIYLTTSFILVILLLSSAISKAAISNIGSVSANGSTITLPNDWQSGDLALVFAFRNGSLTAPTLPLTFTNITTYNPGGTSGASARLAYRFLQTGDISFTFTNATEIQVIVLRGTATTNPVSKFVTGSGISSNSMSYSALPGTTLSSSWIVGFGGHRTATDVYTATASSMTIQSATTATKLGMHSLTGVTSFSQTNWSTVNASSTWITIVAEVLEYTPPMYFQSVASGDWSATGTWEQSTDGSSWVPATRTPNGGDYTITILSGHTVHATTTISSYNNLTVYGTYEHRMNGGTIPSATWNSNSTCLITGIVTTAPSGLNQIFGNFKWSCTLQSSSISLEGPSSITGTFTVVSTGGNVIRPGSSFTYPNYVQTGGTFIITTGTNRALTIENDYLISGGLFYFTQGIAAGTLNVDRNFSMTGGTLTMSSGSGVGTLNVIGNFTHSGGTITETSTGTGRIVFTGTGTQTYTSDGTISNTINFTVNSGAYLQMGTGISPAIISDGSSGTFTLSSGATLGVTSHEGITSTGSSGNIQVTGTRTYDTGANYIYNGTAAQNTGNGLPATVSNLTFNNTGGAVIFNSARTITNNFSINYGSVADLSTFLTHSAGTLTLGGAGAANGSWGSTGSTADNQNDTYFLSSSPGIINITNSSLTAGTWLGGTVDHLTDWNTGTNWYGGTVPVSTTDVIIPAYMTNQPVISAFSTNPDPEYPAAECTNLTITTGASLTVNPGGRATVSGTLTNNGTLNLNSTSSSDIFSLKIDGNYSGSGNANVQLFLTGGGTKPYWKWHYVAVPVDGLSKTYFTNINALNLRAYDDSRVTTSDFNGWSWHDGYAGTPGIPGGGGFDNLSYGKGYLFWHDSDATVNFTGMPSLGTTLGTASLQYSGSTPELVIYGYNFLGNSLTCSLNWDNVTFAGSVNQAVYFTTNNQWVSYIEGGGGTNGGSPYIPPLQGFFVKADATGASIDLSGAKAHSSQARYKKSDSSVAEAKEDIIYPKVKLELNGTETSDETIVWFNDEATTGYDLKYDGYKLFSQADFGQLYSTFGGTNYVINGISLPSDSIIVPLGVKIAQAGSYSLLKKVLEELDNYDVYLIDKANGSYIVDLKKSDKYTFSSDAGTFIDRFVLKFASLTTSAEAPKVINKNFNIYSTENFINILPPDDFASVSDGIVRIYNLTGRIVKQVNNIGLYGGSLLQIPFTGPQGVYIVEITSGLSSYKGKVLVK
jgi:hypothetical protein